MEVYKNMEKFVVIVIEIFFFHMNKIGLVFHVVIVYTNANMNSN